MKNILFIILILSTITGFSQTDETGRRINFGFNLGANYTIVHSQESLPNEAEISNGLGFNLGILMDYKVSKKFIFSPKVELSFNNGSINSKNSDGSFNSYNVLPVSVNVMTHFVYKLGNSGSFYFLAGPNFKLPVFNNSESTTDYGSNYDLAIDFGIGLEGALAYFIVAPELKYSFGLLDVNQNPMYRNINMHTISIVFSFK